MFNIIPIDNDIIHIELPPLLNKGRVWPVVGKRPKFTPILMKACVTNKVPKPKTTKYGN